MVEAAHPFKGSALHPTPSSLIVHSILPPSTTMRPLKLYEHPEFKAEDQDVSLLTTICFVFTLAMTGAIFILSISCLLFWDDCQTCEYFSYRRMFLSLITRPAYPIYSARPHPLTVHQVLTG